MVENEEFRVEINEENFPDKVFREYVKTNFDIDKDGFLSEDEICNVCKIDLNKKEVFDLKGIEYFTHLMDLRCYDTKISKLNVSKNTALENLTCVDTKIQELDVSKNTALKGLNFQA